MLNGQPVGFQVFRYAGGIERRYFKPLHTVQVGNQTSCHIGNFMFGHQNFRTEGLGLYRQVHNNRTGRRAIRIHHILNGFVMDLTIRNSLASRMTRGFNTRMSHDQQCLPFFLVYNLFNPLVHFYETKEFNQLMLSCGSRA